MEKSSPCATGLPNVRAVVSRAPGFVCLLRRGSLAAGLFIFLVAMAVAPARGATYVVKRGDSLWSVAQKHGTTVSELADRNGLSRSGHLYVGQRLKLPGAKAKAALPENIQRAIDQAPVRTARWRYIVIHHSGVDRGDMKSMDQYHRTQRHMENGLAYHFVIGNGDGMRDGEIGVAPRWTKQLAGGHLASEAQNNIAIGICLVGNFDRRPPSAKQMQSLRLVVDALRKRCKLNLKAVKTHQQINVVHTRCPGAKFPSKSLQKLLGP